MDKNKKKSGFIILFPAFLMILHQVCQYIDNREKYQLAENRENEKGDEFPSVFKKMRGKIFGDSICDKLAHSHYSRQRGRMK